VYDTMTTCIYTLQATQCSFADSRTTDEYSFDTNFEKEFCRERIAQ
jgi:hypothetical protein